MKKIIAFLLAAVMLLSMTACQTSKPNYEDPDFQALKVASKDVYSDYEGVSVQVDDIYLEDGRIDLVVVWSNKTQYDVIFGASYVIERFENGEWVNCAMRDDMSFIAIAYELKAGRLQNEAYNLTNMYDVSKAGTYRFKTTCSVNTGSNDTNNLSLWAEFTLNKDLDESQIKTPEPIEYGVQYIRTNGYMEGAEFPNVVIIRSRDELNAYYEANKDTFELERKDKVYSDTTVGFLDACDKYDEEYFEKGYLVYVLLEEGSGSIRHEVTGSTISSDGELGIYISTEVPEAGTCDMAQWHIILEMSNAVEVKDESSVQAYLDGNLAWNGEVVELPKPEPAFKTPPTGTLYTPEGDVTLTPVGYSWTVQYNDGTATTTIADQASRPLPQESLKPVILSEKFAETIYLPELGSDVLVPTNAQGYLIKVDWEAIPSSVQINCWPETVWQDSGTPEEVVVYQDGCFYAYQGGYIYEIVATWEDTGAGYHGTVNYYVYICDVNGHGPVDDN